MKPARALLPTLLILALAACGGSGGGVGGDQQPGDQPIIGARSSGDGTYYDADGSGSCLYEPAPDLMVAAMNAPQFDNSSACGMCVEVTGPKGTIVLRIVDVCPECGSGDLDMSVHAFDLIAEHSAGRVPISWVPVACDTSGPLAIRFKEGSSQYWLAVQARNSRIPVKRIEMQTGSGWLTLDQQHYNYHLDEGDPGPGPFTFRLTTIDGQQRVLSNIPLREAQVVEGQGQFD